MVSETETSAPIANTLLIYSYIYILLLSSLLTISHFISLMSRLALNEKFTWLVWLYFCTDAGQTFTCLAILEAWSWPEMWINTLIKGNLESECFSRGLPNNGWRFYSVDIMGFINKVFPASAPNVCRKCIRFSDLTQAVSPSALQQGKEKRIAKLINQGIVQGPEHSCLTLVQIRKEARGVAWITLASKEEEKSRKDRLCFRCCQVMGQMPGTDVISLQLR